MKSVNKEHNYEFDKPVNPNKPDLEYLPKQILHTEFIVNKLNLGDLILMDSSFMHENDVEFEQLEMNNGIRIYIFGDKKSKSIYVVSEGTVSGEFSILSDMMFSSDSEKDATTTNQKEKKDNLIGINSKNKDKKITIENKNEYELRKYAISEQNIIFNSIASKLLESYMDIKDNFENELQNMYFIGHSSGGNKVMNLFANKILNSHEPDKELDRCKCICINSIGWAKKTKNYFENKFQEKNIDFKKFAERVIDIKGSTDMISVINEHPIGKTVFI